MKISISKKVETDSKSSTLIGQIEIYLDNISREIRINQSEPSKSRLADVRLLPGASFRMNMMVMANFPNRFLYEVDVSHRTHRDQDATEASKRNLLGKLAKSTSSIIPSNAAATEENS